jgi:hypothetical protein
VSDITFTSWDLAASARGDTFKPEVPQEYEGIAISSVLRQSARLIRISSRIRTPSLDRILHGSRRKRRVFYKFEKELQVRTKSQLLFLVTSGSALLILAWISSP